MRPMHLTCGSQCQILTGEMQELLYSLLYQLYIDKLYVLIAADAVLHLCALQLDCPVFLLFLRALIAQ